MSQKRDQNQFRMRWPEWLLPAFFLPSWLMSLGFHMVLFVVVALMFQRAGVGEGTGEADRVVDIFVKQDDTTDQDQELSTDETVSTEETTPLTEIDDVAPSDELIDEFLDEPLPIDSVLGAGPVGDVLDLPEVDSVRSVRPKPTASKIAAPKGGTNFIGIKDSGSRFVYVIDCSGSMADHRASIVAKNELKSSIGLLDSTQQFQVIFYNQNPFAWQRRGREQNVYFASDSNKRLANSYIDQISPNGGTEHILALNMGLSKNPEVLYFLTDADRPRPSTGELSRIKQRNKGRARIHCIEFGIGPKPRGVVNWLMELARDNGGTYRYLDVTEF